MFYSTGQEGDPYESIIWKSAPDWRNYWHCRTSESLLEPPLSLHGSISTSWIPRVDREIAEGKLASALITFVKADNLSRLPRWVLVPLMFGKDATEGESYVFFHVIDSRPGARERAVYL